MQPFGGTFAPAQDLCVWAATAQPFHKQSLLVADELAESRDGRIDPHADNRNTRVGIDPHWYYRVDASVTTSILYIYIDCVLCVFVPSFN